MTETICLRFSTPGARASAEDEVALAAPVHLSRDGRGGHGRRGSSSILPILLASFSSMRTGNQNHGKNSCFSFLREKDEENGNGIKPSSWCNVSETWPRVPRPHGEGGRLCALGIWGVVRPMSQSGFVLMAKRGTRPFPHVLDTPDEKGGWFSPCNARSGFLAGSEISVGVMSLRPDRCGMPTWWLGILLAQRGGLVCGCLVTACLLACLLACLFVLFVCLLIFCVCVSVSLLACLLVRLFVWLIGF